MNIDLQKFIEAAKENPKVAQEVLNALEYDTGEGFSALGMLKDDVRDDSEFHNITSKELEYFIQLTSNQE